MTTLPEAGRLSFFTSVSRQYFAKARILGHTLKRHNPAAFLVVVCVGELPPGFQLADEPFDAVLRVEDLDFANPKALCFKYNVTELCTAVKAAASLKIMDAFGAERVIYLDPDTAVFDSLAPLADWLDETSILLTPHQTVPETERFFIVNGEILFLKRGVFNAGFFGVKNDDTGRRFLSWWNDRLMQYCLDDSDEHLQLQGQHRLLGLFTDQKWFDLVPCFFERHRIIHDPGYNVATWNLSRHAFTRTNTGDYEVDGRPLRFFHFSGVDSGAHAEMLDIIVESNPRARDVIALSDWYSAELEKHENTVLLKLPYTYARYSDGEPIPGAHRRIYAVEQEAQRRFTDPFVIGAASSYREWAQERLSPAHLARIARQRQRFAALRASSVYRWAVRTRWTHRLMLAIRKRCGLM